MLTQPFRLNGELTSLIHMRINRLMMIILCSRLDICSSALSIQIYLKLERHDLAKKELKKLTEIDEDAIITQLSAAWVYMATVS